MEAHSSHKVSDRSFGVTLQMAPQALTSDEESPQTIESCQEEEVPKMSRVFAQEDQDHHHQEPPTRLDSLSSCRLKVGDLSIRETLHHGDADTDTDTNTNTNTNINHGVVDPNSSTFAQESSKVRKGRRQKRDKQKKIQEAAAETAALYYGECYMQGVGGTAADRAAQESHEKYKKWWLQDFNNNLISSVGDAHVVPKYNDPISSHRVDQVSGKRDIKSKPELDCDQTTQSKKNASSDNATDDGLSATKDSKYCTVTDYEYDNNNSEWLQIGGIANSTARITLENDFNDSFLLDQNTPHINNCSSASRQKTLHLGQLEDQTIIPQYAVQIAVDRSRGARNPSPVAKDVDFNNQRVPSDSGCKQTKKKRQRQKSQDYNNLSEFFSLVRPETDKDFRKERDNNDGGDTSQLLPRRQSSSFFHDASNMINKFSNSCTKNGSWETLSEKMIDDGAQTPSSDEKYNAILTSLGNPKERRSKHIDNAKLALLHSLAVSSGDVTSPQFLFALEQLRTLYNVTEWDVRGKNGHRAGETKKNIEGMWLNLSRPNFQECIGKNSSGEYMYTLGRMSFDMFAPSSLVCSIKGIFNHIEVVDMEKDGHKLLKSVPKSLREEVSEGKTTLRKYDIVTAFSIEPDSPQFGSSSPNKCVQRPLRGIITTFGYVLPDPKTPNRLSIWFSGGKIEPNEDDNILEEWKRAFGGGLFKRHLQEKARLLAAKLLLGAEVPEQLDEDGSMTFQLNRPIGGHGSAYVDILYLDETLRIVQGHRGSLYIFSRVSH